MKREKEGNRMKVNILLFEDFETLDIFGPIEILARVEEHELEYYSIDGGIVKSAQGTEIITNSIDKAEENALLLCRKNLLRFPIC